MKGKFKYNRLATIALCAMLASCASKNEDPEATSDGEQSGSGGGKDKVGSGILGGRLNLAVNEPIQSLYPHAVFDLATAQISEQVFESLVGFDSDDLTIVPELAESWTITEDGLKYTFVLRKGIKFHDDACFSGGKGRELKAADVKYSMELLATAKKGSNANFENSIKDIVEGATEFHNGQTKEIKGVRVVDDYTIEFTLVESRATFLHRMGTLYTAVVAKEAFEKYGEQGNVGTGPFKFASLSASRDEIVLVKNHAYYMKDADGAGLPYLDTVAFKVYDRKVDELFAFQEGKLSVITGLPASKVSEVVQEDIQEYSAQPPTKILVRKPQLSTQYYEFNLTKPHFKDIRVRQAFNYAINRKDIIENVLSNQANGFGEYGITPPMNTFKGYNYDAIKEVSYEYNPEKARQLMAQAGFPNGKGFPDVQLLINSGGAENNAVATEVANQLNRVLGVNVSFTSLPFAKKVQEAQYGRGDIYRTAWVADYPSPESFLLNFYGKFVPNSLDQPSWPNTSRYKSAKFDELFEAGMRTTNKDERLALFSQAEVEMMKDAPAIILWYMEDYNMHMSAVRNLSYSPLQVLNLSQVYFKAWTPEEWKNSKQKK